MNCTVIKQSYRNAFKQIQLGNDILQVSFLPELGGKMIQLKNVKTGTQFLKTPGNPDTDYHKSDYGAYFETSDASGFDECFPTVEPTTYINPFSEDKLQIEVPDHGEVWSSAWDYNFSDNELVLTTFGKQLDYKFQKSIKLNENVVHIEYELTNNAAVPFHYLWSAHPLLNISEGDQLLLPEEIQDVFLNWSSDPGLGSFGDILNWPVLTHKGSLGDINFSVVQSKSFGKAVKLFSSKLRSNRAGLYRHEKDESLLFHFNPKETPFLGLWLCYGGWPGNGKGNHFTVGIEPTSGRPDSLTNAIASDCSKIIYSKQTHHWYLDISLWQGKLNA